MDFSRILNGYNLKYVIAGILFMVHNFIKVLKNSYICIVLPQQRSVRYLHQILNIDYQFKINLLLFTVYSTRTNKPYTNFFKLFEC